MEKSRKQSASSTPAGTGKPVQYGTFNEDVLDSYSGVLHAATHHLVELSAYIFKDNTTTNIMQAAAEWNARSQIQFKAYKKH